jgi:hypothetical protein
MIEVGEYRIDLAMTERLTYEADVTEHAMERGVDSTDHVRAKLAVLELEAVVSDTPIGRIALVRQLDGSVSPSREAFETFQKIHFARKPLRVVCSYGPFDLMVLASLETTKDAESQHAFLFTATFKEIRIVETERTTVKVRAGSGGGKRDDRGHVVPKWTKQNTTYDVVSKPASERAQWVPQYGQPLLTTDPVARASANGTDRAHEPFAGLYSGLGVYDHFQWNKGPKNLGPDGFVLDIKYYRYSKGWKKQEDGSWVDTFHGNTAATTAPSPETPPGEDEHGFWKAVNGVVNPGLGGLF